MTALPSNLENSDNLTDLNEIQKAYDQLCKEEVISLGPSLSVHSIQIRT